jgi:hypothetical protein
MSAAPHIVGKDYLTRQEAAWYACISPRQFDQMRRLHGIAGIPWAGKVVYRKTDIQRAIEQAAQWQPSPGAATAGSSNGARAAGSAAKALAARVNARPTDSAG